MPRVTLIGYRGTGKSTVGALVAARLGVACVDADTVLEGRVGSSIAELVRGRGEAAFRDVEAEVLSELLGGWDGVLATGGGVVVRPGNRDLLRRLGRPVVWLDAPAAVIRARLAGDPATQARRPGLRGGDPLAEIEPVLREREPLYRQCADWTIDASVDPAAVADRIVEWLAGWRETRS